MDETTASTSSMKKERLLPCPFTGPKMFCASPNFLCRTKNLFTYCARTKDDLHSVKLVFVPAQKFLRRH